MSFAVKRNNPFGSNFSRLTLAIIALNLVAFVLPFIYYFEGPYNDSYYNFLILGWQDNYDVLTNGEYYRLITSIFLHGGFTHLFVNMFSLYQLGPIIQKIFKDSGFLLIYFVAGIWGSIFSLIFSPTMPSVGASGAIFGLLGALIVWALKEKDKDLLTQLGIILLLNLLIGLTVPNIGNWAHLGGLLSGGALAFLLMNTGSSDNNFKFRY
jgi:rhomboid protease GluP